MTSSDQLDRSPAYWITPEVNPRRASLRYRCIYPMIELQQRGLSVSIYKSGDHFVAGTPFVFDAWNLFPSVSKAGKSDELLVLARKLKDAGAKIIVDNCDNQFSAPTEVPGWSAGLQRLSQLCEMADVMVCCSAALAQTLQARLPSRAQYRVIDDPIEEKIVYPGDSRLRRMISPAEKMANLKLLRLALQLKISKTIEKRTPLLWYGSHGNQFAPGGMLDILTLRPILERVNASHPISLTIISNHRRKFDENFADWIFPMHYLEWDRANFLQALPLHEVSIIPVEDNPFTRCKSSNRLTLSVHHGLTTVASAVPSYLQFSDVVRIGNWEHNLLDLLQDKMSRSSELAKAQASIRSSHCLASISNGWQALLFGRENQAY